jgi:quinol monooxygenase YgiN
VPHAGAPSTIREDEMSQEIHINVRFQAKPGKQAELSRRMLELRPDVEALGGTSSVTVDSEDETVLYFIEMFPDQAALDADMKTPLVQALIADLGELTIHGTDFRIERSSPVAA